LRLAVVMTMHVSSHKTVTRISRAARLGIRAVSFVLPLLYAWLSFKNLSLPEILRTISDSTALDVLWKSILVLYYTAWVFGASNDVNFQEDVSLIAPNEGSAGFGVIGLFVVFLIVAAMLLYSPNYELFVTFLTIFFATNVLGYTYIARSFSKPMFDASHALYEKDGDYFGLEKLAAVEHYQIGRWQVWRFVVGFLIICGMIGIAVRMHVPHAPIPFIDEVPIQLTQSIGMFLFVLLMEVWIWTMRVKTIATLSALNRLAARYVLSLPR
jgi:hypothetical protein